MEHHRKIINEILDGMEGIGGIPFNEEFYEEFDFRLRAALRLKIKDKKCCWK